MVLKNFSLRESMFSSLRLLVLYRVIFRPPSASPSVSVPEVGLYDGEPMTWIILGLYSLRNSSPAHFLYTSYQRYFDSTASLTLWSYDAGTRFFCRSEPMSSILYM